jgi:hypothetical protein
MRHRQINIDVRKMYLREMECAGVDRIRLAKDRIQSRAPVDMNRRLLVA